MKKLVFLLFVVSNSVLQAKDLSGQECFNLMSKFNLSGEGLQVRSSPILNWKCAFELDESNSLSANVWKNKQNVDGNPLIGLRNHYIMSFSKKQASTIKCSDDSMKERKVLTLITDAQFGPPEIKITQTKEFTELSWKEEYGSADKAPLIEYACRIQR
jgi:hypothetical protein